MGDYHPTDVERVKTDDTYVLWFFESKGAEEAPDAIDVALKFRKNMGLHGNRKKFLLFRDALFCFVTFCNFWIDRIFLFFKLIIITSA